LSNLKDVNDQVLPLFEETSEQLIEDCGGDTKKALKMTLAYLSGYYKQIIESRSLLTG